MVAMAHVGGTPSALSPGMSVGRACGVCERDGIHGAHAHWQTGRSSWGYGSPFSATKKMKSKLFGQVLDQYPSFDKELARQAQAHVAAVHSTSQSDAFKQCKKLGYHPLEELSQSEKKQLEQRQHGKLSDAEVARTITEVNCTAILLAAFSPQISVLRTDIHYLVDEQGEFYFEIDNDNEFLRNISSSPTCSVLIGIDSVDDIIVSDILSASDDQLDTDDESEDEDDEFGEDWELLMLDDAEEDSFSTLENWGGSETLDDVHPMEFASKLSQSMTRDLTGLMYRPSRSLTITGIVRHVTKEEEPYIKKLWNDRYVSDDDEYEEEDRKEHESISTSGCVVENIEVVEDASCNTIVEDGRTKETLTRSGALEVLESLKHEKEEERSHTNIEGSLKSFIDVGLPNQDMITAEIPLESHGLDNESLFEKMEFSDAETKSKAEIATNASSIEESLVPRSPDLSLDGPTVLSEWYEEVEAGTSFYKLEIFSIELNANSGNQSFVDVKDFLYAKPDILGNDASSLVDQINAGGNKFESALKVLCQREKGIKVEEALVVDIDSLGVDVRISCGIEIKNIRFSFNRRAKCVDSAEKLFKQLLYPRSRAKQARKGRRMK